MTLLSQAKTFGGVGSILVILVFVPTIGWLLALVGFILVLVAVKYVSDSLTDKTVFNDMLYSVLAAIAGVLVGGLYIAASVISFFGFNFSNISTYVPPVISNTSSKFISFALSILAGLVVVWIALVVSAIFLRRSYSTIGTKLNVSMFNTTALLYLIGAATTIVAVGFAILLVAEIFQIISFFSLPEALPQTGTSPPV